MESFTLHINIKYLIHTLDIPTLTRAFDTIRINGYDLSGIGFYYVFSCPV